MSTRCAVQVTVTDMNNGLVTFQYYRPFDGYPTGTGVDLIRKGLDLLNRLDPKALASLDVESALRHTLTLNYQPEYGEVWHDDLDYIYHMDFDNGFRIWCHKRVLDHLEHKDWRKWPRALIFYAELYDGGFWSLQKIAAANDMPFRVNMLVPR